MYTGKNFIILLLLLNLHCRHVLGFIPPRPTMPFKTVSTRSHLSILGNEVDVAVLAAAGLAVIGGAGVLVLKSQIQDLPSDPLTNGSLVEDAKPVAVESPVLVVADDSTQDKKDSGDISIPYDAPARFAYESSGMKVDYATFKASYEADAVADVIAKKKARDAATTSS
jgi:hypothetical protein